MAVGIMLNVKLTGEVVELEMISWISPEPVELAMVIPTGSEGIDHEYVTGV